MILIKPFSIFKVWSELFNHQRNLYDVSSVASSKGVAEDIQHRQAEENATSAEFYPSLKK